jgi:cyclic beta-1,2-glucan synthetase
MTKMGGGKSDRASRTAGGPSGFHAAPLRHELLNIVQLRGHARELARWQKVDPRGGPNDLLHRLAANERVLLDVYDLVAKATVAGRRIAPAAEWLIDNFYLIEQQIRIARLHLPRSYGRRLPRLLNEGSENRPRVYDMALELISHVDGRVDAESAAGFVAAYQEVSPLKLGELWAFPIMLRLGLIENLRRIADGIALRRRHRDLAMTWAERLIRTADKRPRELIQILADLDRSAPPMSAAFVQEFYSRIQGRGVALEIVLSWIEHELSEQGMTTDQIVRADSQEQVSSQVSVANNIASLRFLSAMDWRRFVEDLSLTERALRLDPAGAYARQEFETRDRCRHAVERVAARSPASEEAVAARAVDLAAESARAEPAARRRSHVGYYLLDKGRRRLEKSVGRRRTPGEVIAAVARAVPLGLYVLPIVAASGAVAAAATLIARSSGLSGFWLWLLAAAAFTAGSSAGVSVTNTLALRLVRPRMLPRLDFSGGIPDEHRTMVVVPNLLTSAEEVAKLLEDAEIRYLGNRDRNLLFGLLTDFADAAQETMPGDEALLEQAREGVRALNQKYAAEDGRESVFFFFQRKRVWNRHERLWMGYERKRGKLEQFNALLRGGPDEPFQEIIGDRAVLPTIKYVICLDRDTHLPRDAGARLVGTMAHPLNRPVIDPRSHRVVEGYAILQPRVSVRLTAANRSLFSRLVSGESGIDPYTREVSDVYQDLFGEGSYVGKGIYDVDAFREATAGRFPENLILSHDLIEGGYARSALVTDIELVEDLPSSYTAEASRRHRWTRGDWQISGWILPRPRSAARRRARNPLTLLSRWKILDNLRRSLVAPALFAILAVGLAADPALSVLWVVFALAVLAFGPLAAIVFEAVAPPRGRSWSVHWRTLLEGSGRRLAEAALSLVFLPYDTLIRLGAIARSGLRLPFFRLSRRGLLLWYTARSVRRDALRGQPGFWLEMWFEPLSGAGLAAWLAMTRPAALWAAGPILAAWLAGPAIAWWISRPLTRGAPQLSESQRVFLRGLARRTWTYFEEFVGTDGKTGLPPDNFQEYPEPRVAARTSPTNLGLNLQANLAALDFGYLSPGRFLQRTDAALTAMEKLERFRGHFYNWYDTRTGDVLPPRYVSSVDSGNLLGSLMVLRAGLGELGTWPVWPPSARAGLLDAVEAVASALSGPGSDAAGRLLEDLRAALAPPADTLPAALSLLDKVRSTARDLGAALDRDGRSDARRLAGALERQAADLREDLDRLVPDPGSVQGIPSLTELARLPASRGEAAERLKLVDSLSVRVEELEEMNFDFLYDRGRDLLAIGYRVADRRPDPSYYDLLASEARFSSFVLISRGLVPQRHWFALSRLLTRVEGGVALLSWSGSMFEYLMPLLWMPMYDHTLLDQTYRAVVASQRDYGRERGVPWGISESCYNAADSDLNYQYGAFGVPGLGFKRDLAEDLVIAPYASALALMVFPGEACKNLRRMSAAGFVGRYGFYESIDYTPSRLPRGKSHALVRAFMTHHQGMTFLALENVLLGGLMQRRFISDPMLRASELLLHERVPAAGPSLQPHEPAVRVAARSATEAEAGAGLRIFTDPNTPLPEVHLLSNGSYHVMTTAAGGGYSRWRDRALTRWREDSTAESWGTFLYLRDLESGRFWSSAYQPTRRQSDTYEAIFAPARTEYRRRDARLETYTEIAVSPEDDVEIRRVRVTNLSDHPRRVEVTSYAEVILDSLNADISHRAFSNLFVETEILRDRQALLCHRRKRRPDEEQAWMLHFLAAPAVGAGAGAGEAKGAGAGEPSWETDREKFIGRNRTPENPKALERGSSDWTEDRDHPLSNSEGPVLDPIVAARQSFEVPADGTVEVSVITGAAPTREAALALIDKYRDPRFVERAFEMAWSHNQVQLRNLGASEADAQAFERLASSVLLPNRIHRAPGGVLAANRLGQSGLWRFGISGDLPLTLVRIGRSDRLDLVRDALKAHALWRTRGLPSDLVILNEDFSGYRQVLQDAILQIVRAGPEAHLQDKPGGVFVRRGEELTEEERVLFQAVARVVLVDSVESLAEQAAKEPQAPRLPASFKPGRKEGPEPASPLPPRDRILANGLGGFTADGREYVVTLEPGRVTPAPWANVIAGPHIGAVVSESGGSYTWVENAHEFRLTAWPNDPLSDASSEAFYIRDEETGRFWSPTPLPAPGVSGYVCRHGFGYSVFEHYEADLFSEMWVYASVDEPVKLAVIRMRNHSGRKRRVSLTGYWELTLGEWRHLNQMHIVTRVEPRTGALLAQNAYARDFSERVVFATVSEPNRSVTGNRVEFLGRNGTLRSPAAMRRTGLSGRTGAGLDPCAALSAVVDLADGEERDIVFVLGAGQGPEDAQRLIDAYSGAGAARQTLEAVWERWNRLLGTVHVETPDPAVDVLVNGWLAYQAISSRLWGRTGYYQSSGAYGFRDQLQDTMSLAAAVPELAREHILLCAEHQFREGDVQHWWHPPSGRGVRTHISDDALWLPYAVARYVRITGDTGLLDERRAFLEGRPLGAGEDDRFDIWQVSSETGTVYEHCLRAIKHALRFGPRGLPLIGSGDWNDGLNLVGRQGRGESVWLAFFLFGVLREFGALAEARADGDFAQLCRDKAEDLRRNVESAGWDGDWYLRAFFDDGRPLGSASDPECRIDSLPQSWAVISGLAPAGRARKAMDAAVKELYAPASGLVKLFDPPFDKSDLEPGYVKGYPPGVRENGGHYSHAGVWAAIALARLGDKGRAWELWRALNPIRHSETADKAAVFRVEPYVMAADICSAPPHVGRGGWSWYTGSAGWMYRLTVEELLGLRLEVDKLRLEPRLPDDWKGWTVHYRFRETFYHLAFRRQGEPGDKGKAGDKVVRLTLDGQEVKAPLLPLKDDHADHRVEVVIGR